MLLYILVDITAETNDLSQTDHSFATILIIIHTQNFTGSGFLIVDILCESKVSMFRFGTVSLSTQKIIGRLSGNEKHC